MSEIIEDFKTSVRAAFAEVLDVLVVKASIAENWIKLAANEIPSSPLSIAFHLIEIDIIVVSYCFAQKINVSLTHCLSSHSVRVLTIENFNSLENSSDR